MKYIIVLLVSFGTFLYVKTHAKQIKSNVPITEYDTTLVLFKNPEIVLRLKLFDENQEDFNQCNAVLTLSKRNGDKLVECFRDSLYAWRPGFELGDFNGDNVKDIIIKHHMSIGNSNEAYSLYLVDSRKKTLVKVKGFEEIYNPEFIKHRKLIKSWALSGNSIWWAYYKIGARGRLHKVSRNYEERASE